MTRARWITGLAFVCAVALAIGVHAYGAHFMLGGSRDDGIYALAGRALAHGQGYIDLSLPDHPQAKRYPPGFPAILALAETGTQDLGAEVRRLMWVAPLSAGCLLVTCYGYYRRRAAMPAASALGLALLVALQPSLFMLSAVVMAELPFALICLLVVWGGETALVAEAGTFGWMMLGLASAGACLVRYAGVALVAAVAATLLSAKRPRALLSYLAAVALTLVPWLLYQHASASSDYATVFVARLHSGAGLFAVTAGTVLIALFANALPSVLAGIFFLPGAPPTALSIATGVGIALIPVRGVINRFQSQRDWARLLPVLFVLATSLMIGFYALGFAFYASTFLQRALVPVMPFVALLAFEGIKTLLTGTRPAWASRFAGIALAAALACNIAAVGYMLSARPTESGEDHDLQAMFAFAREKLPAGAVLFSPFSHQVSFYTGHPCVMLQERLAGDSFLPTLPSLPTTIELLARGRVQYILGVPYFIEGNPNDLSIQLIDGLLKGAPGLLRLIKINESHTMVLFSVDQLVLARLSSRATGTAR